MKPVVGLLRQMGIRLIVYLDDMLIMAQSQDKQPPTRLNCPRSFRRVWAFMINYQKSVLGSSTKMKFLGFVVDSLTLSLALPRGKIRKVRKECQSESVLTGLATSNSETTSHVTGPPYLYHSSCLSRAPPLPPLAKREKQGFSTFSNLRLLYPPFPLRRKRSWFGGGTTWKHGMENLSSRVLQT